ncbi:MAG: hypothetical protein ACR2KT_09150 [Methylocella sp.]
MPKEDSAIQSIYQKYLSQLKKPKKLSDILDTVFGDDPGYIAVFIPGGHGALLGIPESKEVKDVLFWAMHNDRYVISLCHGPSSLLSTS